MGGGRLKPGELSTRKMLGVPVPRRSQGVKLASKIECPDCEFSASNDVEGFEAYKAHLIKLLLH